MLDAIEETHKSGFIHRDIKAVSLQAKLIFLVKLCLEQEWNQSVPR